MLDQSFSAKNFYNILIYQNRKGENLEGRFFQEEVFEQYTVKVKHLNSCIRERRKEIKFSDKDDELFFRYRRFLRYLKKKIKQGKKQKLLELLGSISDNINRPSFKIELSTAEARGKAIYMLADTPENYFLNKQLQYNFRKTYKVKQSNRFQIVDQVASLLEDKFPKYIIRTDLKSFYESVPVDEILNKIHEDNLLSPMSKRFVRQIIKEYKDLSGNTHGIPRGIGISAYLSELYLRKIDNEIKNATNLLYYQRYVDDIIAIFFPETVKNHPVNYLQTIEEPIKANGLELNTSEGKTKEVDLTTIEKKTETLDYLGYRYVVDNNSNWQGKKLRIELTDRKINRFKQKIDLSIEVFKDQALHDKKRASKLLKSRIVFLTSNTRLTNNKGHILTGVYFSNRLLDPNASQLKDLDTYLASSIDSLDLTDKQKTKLKSFTFISGFKSKRFVKFSTAELSLIMKAWKSL